MLSGLALGEVATVNKEIKPGMSSTSTLRFPTRRRIAVLFVAMLGLKNR